MNAPSSRRYLSVWLRRLATDRIERHAPPETRNAPLATVAQTGNALRLVAVNDALEGFGVKPGTTLADARALHPGLATVEADEGGERRCLEAIAEWCDRYTPLVALDPPDGLMLDITGAAHLFGGEEAMRRDILRRLARQGFRARAAIADTAALAWGMARFGTAGIVARGGAREALRALPFAALHLDMRVLEALRRTGFATVGEVMELARAPLAARFGSAFLRRLGQALGEEEEALVFRRPPPAVMAERVFAEPILREEDILATAERLGGEMGTALARRDEGARRIELALFRVDGAVSRIEVGTGRPVRDAGLIRRLFAEKLAGLHSLDTGYGFDLVRLSALASEVLLPGQLDLAEERPGGEDVAELVDRLAARLGPDNILRLLPQNSHLPERAVSAVPAQEAQGVRIGSFAAERQDSAQPARPIRLFEPPEMVEATAEVPDGPPVRFRWRRVLHDVARAEGPERIATEWWLEPGRPQPTRDYFRVETSEGRRFWLFREGLYGRETSSPRWFMHGVFA